MNNRSFHEKAMSKRSPIKTGNTRAFQTLDPCTLGRPTHRLGRFSATALERLVRFFEGRLNPRYGTSFELGELTFSTRESALPLAELPGGTAATAGIAVALDRAVLLRILACRYGRHSGHGNEITQHVPHAQHVQDMQGPPKPQNLPSLQTASEPAKLIATASERRIAAHLGAELRELLADCIGHDDTPNSAESGMSAQRTQAALRFSCRITDLTQGEIGWLYFTLDTRWQACVFAHLSSARSRTQAREITGDLKTRLPVKLAVRLMETGMPLHELLALRQGSVIPVQIGSRAQVLAGLTPLFTAQVAEDNGRLCLTAFEDTE
jgi:flagellar motor switch protein FliM